MEQLGSINEQPVLTGPFGTSLGKSDFIDEGVPVLTIGCLTYDDINLEKAVYISEEKAESLGSVVTRYPAKERGIEYERRRGKMRHSLHIS